METKEFDYTLPRELIAQHPAARRDGARMMVVRRDVNVLEHRQFRDLPDILSGGDLLVLNNTRVLPARVRGRKAGSGGRIELLLLEEREPGVWEALLKARRRPAPGARLTLGGGEEAQAIVLEEGAMGRVVVRIECSCAVPDLLEQIGEPPLPPYISRKEGPPGGLREDRERYQTLFAREPGAVAAPTAGLHFTPEIFGQLDQKGVRRTEVTLHVGIGTFRPVEAERVEDHAMEAERYRISMETANAVRETRRSGGRIVAVGSTAVRTLENAAARDGTVEASEGRTDLFIRPGHRFRMVDAMLTNFHLPRSTLIMMVCAFAGKELIMRAYREAIEQRYRFYSYGDCMLIV